MTTRKRTEDEYLPNGSIVYWSRRTDPYVPVRCGRCGQERIIEYSCPSSTDFTGLCNRCVKYTNWEDEALPNGSIIFWSRREGYKVLVQCGRCGKERITHASGVRAEKFTGLCHKCLHTGPGSPTWRGGRVMKSGYVYVRVYPDNPFFESMANKLGYVAEHRLVMAEHLGRPLKPTEIVHHKNGVKTDNRIENLQLFVSLEEHGKALQERHPHPGYESVEKLTQAFFERLKSLLGSDE